MNNDKTIYRALEPLAIQLGLPQSYLRQLANDNQIPFLNVNGRRRFNPRKVQEALDGMADTGGQPHA